jgi:hypothetical protein
VFGWIHDPQATLDTLREQLAEQPEPFSQTTTMLEESEEPDTDSASQNESTDD